MKLITKSKILTKEFIRLTKQYEHASFATAWASSEHDAFKNLNAHPNKIKHSTIGLHFYQTAPEVLEQFKNHDHVRFILQTDGVFHPKLYLFWNTETDWALLSGSANFTKGAFAGNNQEMMLMMTGNSADFFQEIQSFLKQECFEQATTINDDGIKKYRELYLARQKTIQTLSNVYKSGKECSEMQQNILTTNILTYSWPDYLKTIQRDKHHDFLGRLDVLAYVKRHFQEYANFLDIDLEIRKFIAGLPNHAPTKLDYAWFGSTNSNGNFSKKISNENQEFAKAIDMIPLSGNISRADFVEYSQICKSAGYVNPVGVSTRLLAMKRPDLFFCFNGQNKEKMCKELGIKNIQNIDGERYWDEILQRIYDTPWFNNKPFTNDKIEIQAWNNRVALIDCIYYEPKSRVIY
ncbi:phospholipase D family protein [Neisseria weixii]|uniref:phospholipase D family protein n=1 Tax=Neisseria weixii TaxID=1853276 RepID=UPI0035A09693